MKMWKIFLLGAVALALATAGFAQPAGYTFYYFDEGSGTNPPLGCPCTSGTAYPDGVDICLYWDENENGFSADDPQPGTGTDYGEVIQNCYTFNGEDGGIGRGYFVTDNQVYFTNPLDPDSVNDNPYYYWKISAAVGEDACCWYSDTFRVNPGEVLDVYMTIDDWTCITGLCPTEADTPSVPTNVVASEDDQCLAVMVSWQHDGEDVTSFKVYRDSAPDPVATANASQREISVPEVTTTRHAYYVRAFNSTVPSDPSNVDSGSTYLTRFYSGPEGNITGTERAGDTDSVRMERPTSQCNSGSKLYLIYNVDENPTQWGLLASCSLCTVMRFTLPSDDTLNFCQLALRCSSFQHANVITWDTTDSVFHLGTPSDADLRELVLPNRFDLAQNFPNPFNPETQIVFNVPTTADVRIRVYNVMGQLVRTLTDQRYTVGVHQLTWDGKSDTGQLVGAGVYLYRMETPGFSMTKKMLLMK